MIYGVVLAPSNHSGLGPDVFFFKRSRREATEVASNEKGEGDEGLEGWR